MDKCSPSLLSLARNLALLGEAAWESARPRRGACCAWTVVHQAWSLLVLFPPGAQEADRAGSR